MLQEGEEVPAKKAPNISELVSGLLEMPFFSQLYGDFNSLIAISTGNI